jgi:hypothetical protein
VKEELPQYQQKVFNKFLGDLKIEYDCKSEDPKNEHLHPCLINVMEDLHSKIQKEFNKIVSQV